MSPLGRVGVWSAALRFGDPAEIPEAAHEFEELGYGALWVAGGAQPGALIAAEAALAATKTVTVATGVVNIWHEAVTTIAIDTARLRAAHPGRFLLGIGCSHAPLIGDRYRAPLSAVSGYLDTLDTAPTPVPIEDRIIGALGPKMLDLARQRSAGSHTYLSTPEHTVIAREALGPNHLLAPELTVVLEPDPDTARATARAFLATYVGLPNYTENLKRTNGFDDHDFADGGSDRLVDTVIAWGDENAILQNVTAHLDAGADHVCVQIATAWNDLAREPLRRLAPALTDQQFRDLRMSGRSTRRTQSPPAATFPATPSSPTT